MYNISISLESVLQKLAPFTGLSADLPQNVFSIGNCQDANCKESIDVPLQSVKFYASGKLLLIADLKFFHFPNRWKRQTKSTEIYLDAFISIVRHFSVSRKMTSVKLLGAAMETFTTYATRK